MEAALASAAIDSETIPGLMDVLNYEPNPFAAIDTSYKFKFCIENLVSYPTLASSQRALSYSVCIKPCLLFTCMA